MQFKLPRLYPIIDLQLSLRPLHDLLREFARAGVKLVQFREKKASSKKFLEEVLQVMDWSRLHNIAVIVNDRVDMVLLSEAQGVHLGQEDLPVAEARKILGWEKIIGCSTHNLPQALEAQESSADYIAIGPIYSTSSKEKPDPIVEWHELQIIRQRINKPLVAIGGITSSNAKRLFDLGIDSVAVIRDILCAEDLAGKIQEFQS